MLERDKRGAWHGDTSDGTCASTSQQIKSSFKTFITSHTLHSCKSFCIPQFCSLLGKQILLDWITTVIILKYACTNKALLVAHFCTLEMSSDFALEYLNVTLGVRPFLFCFVLSAAAFDKKYKAAYSRLSGSLGREELRRKRAQPPSPKAVDCRRCFLMPLEC